MGRAAWGAGGIRSLEGLASPSGPGVLSSSALCPGAHCGQNPAHASRKLVVARSLWEEEVQGPRRPAGPGHVRKDRLVISAA